MAANPEKGGKRPRRHLRPDLQANPRSAAALPATQAIALHASFEPGALGPRLAPPVLDLPAARLPPVTDIRCLNTTRLLPSRYSESVLTRIADDPADLKLIFELDSATNDRLLAEGNQRLGITARELVFDVPYSRIINAAFTHPHPLGARFSTPYRGAWYAGLELATAKAEVLFHRAIQFAEIDWHQPEVLDYDRYMADFNGCFHDLRIAAFGRAATSGSRSAGLGAASCAAPLMEEPLTAAEFAGCLALDSYIASQQLAIQLLEAGSLGIVYPGARRPGGQCIACFRPSLVANVRKGELYTLKWYPDRPATFLRSPRGIASTEAPAVKAL